VTDIAHRIARSLSGHPKIKNAAKYGYYLVFDTLGRLLGKAPMISDYEILTIDPDKADFFGYFTNRQFSPDGTLLIACKVEGSDCQINSFTPEGRFVATLGQSATWTWQQGPMAQWLLDGRVVFNCLTADGELAGQVVDPVSGETLFQTLPVQCLGQRSDVLISLNYRRLAENGTEYGYSQGTYPMACDDLEHDGLWYQDVAPGSEPRFLVSIADCVRHWQGEIDQSARYEINHAQFSPDDSHVAFILRRRTKGVESALYVLDLQSLELCRARTGTIVSHFCWSSLNSILVWAADVGGQTGYYHAAFDHPSGEAILTLEAHLPDGHPSSMASGGFVTDTYPDRWRHQRLFRISGADHQEIGSFYSPLRFFGPERCDLHPRLGPDGTIAIDTTYKGARQCVLIKCEA
jgi:hypothetical protein